MPIEVRESGRSAVSHCPLCGQSSYSEIERRLAVPVFQNYTYATRSEAQSCAVGDLDIVGCQICGFVWNRAFNPEIAKYDPGYENDQTFSGFFKSHFDEMVDRVVAAFPSGHPISILEVGCGQGKFISAIEAKSGKELRFAYGFDPAYRGSLTSGARLRFQPAYATHESVQRLEDEPRIVISRHTIEHVPDPLAFLGAIRSILDRNELAHLFIETPCVQWILDGHVVQDLFYEHCSLFSVQTLNFALQKSGFAPTSINHVFGGQYLWAEAEFSGASSIKVPKSPGFETAVLAWNAKKNKWRELVTAGKGRIAIWGAGAKGMTFAQITDPNAEDINCIIDLNPAKQGRFSPGTGHEIISPSAALDREIDLVLIMNPVYAEEIKSAAKSLGASFSFQCVE